MSPWNDLTELANYHYPLLSRALPEDTLHGHEYDTYKALKDNNKPGLVVMAENDKIIPTKFSKKLLHQLSDSKIKSVIIKGVRHNDIYNKRTWAYILNFLKKI